MKKKKKKKISVKKKDVTKKKLSQQQRKSMSSWSSSSSSPPAPSNTTITTTPDSSGKIASRDHDNDTTKSNDVDNTTSASTEDDDEDTTTTTSSILLHDSILVGSTTSLVDTTSIQNNIVRPVSDSNIIMNRRLDLLGVSVYWICTGLLAEIEDAGFDPQTSRIHDIETLQPKKTSVLRRKGKKIISPMDGRLGSSYVHSLLETSGSGKSNDADCVGHANYLLSYSWNYTFGDIVSTLKEYCTTHSLNPKRTYIWMDCLCINQHRVVESKVNGESGLMNFDQTFPKQLSQIGHLLAMMTVGYWFRLSVLVELDHVCWWI